MNQRNARAAPTPLVARPHGAPPVGCGDFHVTGSHLGLNKLLCLSRWTATVGSAEWLARPQRGPLVEPRWEAIRVYRRSPLTLLAGGNAAVVDETVRQLFSSFVGTVIGDVGQRIVSFQLSLAEMCQPANRRHARACLVAHSDRTHRPSLCRRFIKRQVH